MTVSSWLWSIQGAATLGLIWGIMALGVYLTYRVLHYSDLTVDGSLTLGGAISAVCVASGMQPILAILVATVGGMLAGTITGVLHTKFKIPDLLAGILTQFGLYSINLRIMGKANFGLLNQITLFSQIKDMGVPSKWAGFIVGLLFIIILVVMIYCFFGIEIGCALRATGNNPDMVKAMGGNTKAYIVLGLVIGNGLVAMSGAFLAQYQGYADINMGVGTIVIGLASIMIGEVLFSKRTYFHRLFGVVIGSVVYRIIIAVVLRISMNSNWIIKITSDDMKLITAFIIILALCAPNIKEYFQAKFSKEDQ
ncbi:MAG: ABC transporter permease [Erysipelotrichaceae bacterium]|nr:ABC transporter permease [Erysipelotrichaceae bacterium]MBQ9987747.1 ABC transporter permease [Erysipelotrichales bacterium]MBR3693330.1 ABC transporter permease [Erysipelotrichales bacterium]